VTRPLALAAALSSIASCASPAVEPASPARFALDGAQVASLRQRPELAAKVRASPYAYFRLVSDPFAQHVCDEYADSFLGTQTVNLHGDAHVEQYAVTRDRFGLEDYDRGGFGPAVIDLVRFGASIHVACEIASYPCQPEPAVDAFLEAYRAAVASPDAVPVAPSIVARLRAAAPAEPAGFLQFAEALMTRVTDADLDRRVRARWRELIGVLTTTGGRRPARDFSIVRYGTIGIGTGSALELKFLFRVVGATDAPDDDLLLEMKSVPSSGATCVYRGPTGNMFLPLLPAARIARAMPEVLAYVPASELSRSGHNWWVRSWELGYRELSAIEIASQTELVELARDAGAQLGRGHCQDIADPLEAQLRHAHARSFDQIRPRIGVSARRAASEVLRAWQAFRGSG
jgi:hypothetical protein